MNNAKAPRGAQTQRTKSYVICETRGADKVRRYLARFLLAVFAIGRTLSAILRGFARFGFVAMTIVATFGLFGFGFCHKFLLLGLFARILFILAD